VIIDASKKEKKSGPQKKDRSQKEKGGP